MVKRVVIAIACSLAAYVVAAFVSYVLIQELSSNAHDRGMEAAVTSAFVFGPLGALVAFAIGFVRAGRNPTRPERGGDP